MVRSGRKDFRYERVNFGDDSDEEDLVSHQHGVLQLQKAKELLESILQKCTQVKNVLVFYLSLQARELGPPSGGGGGKGLTRCGERTLRGCLIVSVLLATVASIGVALLVTSVVKPPEDGFLANMGFGGAKSNGTAPGAGDNSTDSAQLDGNSTATAEGEGAAGNATSGNGTALVPVEGGEGDGGEKEEEGGESEGGGEEGGSKDNGGDGEGKEKEKEKEEEGGGNGGDAEEKEENGGSDGDGDSETDS